MSCPFCDRIAKQRVSAESESAVAFPDGYPLAHHHTLVVPKRHVTSVFDLSETERADLWQLVAEVRNRLTGEASAVDFTIGINDGVAAGQTIEHAHVHVIPRREGDVPDPRGGVRWVIPGKADYWSGGDDGP
jgi:diadenosine tetraphosphate (Ap4A) HIT family hydrolase